MTDINPLTAGLDNSDLSAERCVVELQRGRAITLCGDSGRRTITLVETLTEACYAQVLSHGPCYLIISKARAKVTGIPAQSDACCLTLSSDTQLATLQSFAGLAPDVHHESSDGGFSHWHSPVNTLPVAALQDYASAGLNLAVQGQSLPALILSSETPVTPDQLSVDIELAKRYTLQSGNLLQLSSARLPLASAASVELTVFREQHGNAEHVAIMVGKPDTSNVVTVRLHSSCFTGDILGSLRCDCGEQLQDAISSMANEQGGVILYVSQEGRGIGLANKLLAYQLQDQGLDTIEANQSLGFDADQRRYPAAAQMLRSLGISNIKLMTNNPLKIEALKAEGITVVDRVPSLATVNKHNARYLETKRTRSGHLLPTEPVR